MTVHPVLFDDHTWLRFRPLAVSQPVWEIRCGMFNTRERLALGADLTGGTLLTRDYLAPLSTAAGWTPGTSSLRAAPESTLWISGRMVPATAACGELLIMATTSPTWSWHDEAGLVAAALPGTEATAAATAWERWCAGAMTGDGWPGPILGDDVATATPAAGQRLLVPAGTPPSVQEQLGRTVAGIVAAHGPPLQWIWDVVDRTAAAIGADLGAVGGGRPFRREPFGIFAADEAASGWLEPSSLTAWSPEHVPPGVHVSGEAGVHVGGDVELSPGVVLDTASGPVVLDRGCRVGPHSYLQGPLYLGPDSRIKAGATLYGQSSFGIGNRLAGEIGESSFGDFANKQHDGFIGHAVCGAWTNLGAMTTCSDLKNNYGPIRVDLGDGPVDTGRRFMGLLLGDHVKTAIGTLFNTGTCVGFATNIFGTGMPPKHVGSFRWGGAADGPSYAVDKAISTAAIVMQRRDCRFGPEHAELFRTLAAGLA